VQATRIPHRDLNRTHASQPSAPARHEAERRTIQ
jgi:hypothetical protein